MEIIKAQGQLTTEQLHKVIKVLQNGGIVVYPTETCYGIGALCTSEAGVSKLIAYKKRPEGKAISVAVTTRKMAEKYVELNTVAENIYSNFLPGPYTVISRGRGVVDKRLVSEFGSLGIRIPKHPLPLKIIETLGEGITATSANISGGRTPYKIQDLIKNISEKRANMIDIVIDYGDLPKNPPSVVVDTTQPSPTILRGDDKVGLVKGEKINTVLLGEWETSSSEETTDLAKVIWGLLCNEEVKPVVLLLSGELGAGKTQLVKGLAQVLGVKDNILSPTFVFERQYETLSPQFPKLFHYDLWRLEGSQTNMSAAEACESIGIENALQGNNLLAIEWPENVSGLEKYFFGKLKQIYKLEIDYVERESRTFRLFKIFK